MPESYKICPICDTPNHRNAAVCTTCGTTLTDVSMADGGAGRQNGISEGYDYRYGETDLLESSLRRKAQVYLAGVLVVLVLMICGGAALLLAPSLAAFSSGSATAEANTRRLVTNTPRPTYPAPTVTPGPPTNSPTPTRTPTPTITVTPTRTPCVQTVGAGEGLYDLALRCGHNSFDVIPLIVQSNNLSSEIDIRAGQNIEVPWPTPTEDPNAPTPTDILSAGESALGPAPDVTIDATLAAELGAVDASDPFNVATLTLPPGVVFHTVLPEESIISIGYQYETDVEVLERLNPEIQFSQCDFGERFGGADCVVLLGAGQQIRVPGPTPTPTLSPTPNGSETPTPSATPTFNAPSAVSPSNRAYFRRDEFVTLRWVSTGVLGENEAYQVDVENVTTGEEYTEQTRDLFLLVPEAWHGKDEGRYEYRWTVSVVNLENPEERAYTTDPLIFTWEGLGVPDE